MSQSASCTIHPPLYPWRWIVTHEILQSPEWNYHANVLGHPMQRHGAAHFMFSLASCFISLLHVGPESTGRSLGTVMCWSPCRLHTDPAHSPSLNSDKITENKEVKRWVENYLGVGEWIMDQSVAVLGSSGWFERRR
jgi:hypothetical protein